MAEHGFAGDCRPCNPSISGAAKHARTELAQPAGRRRDAGIGRIDERYVECMVALVPGVLRIPGLYGGRSDNRRPGGLAICALASSTLNMLPTATTF